MKLNTEAQRMAVEKLAMHLQDNLPMVNECMKAGAITKDEWRDLLVSISVAWEKFAEIFGASSDVFVKRHIDRVLGQPMRSPYPEPKNG